MDSPTLSTRMPTILVTGAASGLGLAFLKHYLSIPSPPNIITVDRHPIPRFCQSEGPSYTCSDPKSIPRYSTHILDISSESSLHDMSKKLKGTPIDLLIHCAGIRGLAPLRVAAHVGDAAKAETIEAMDAETIKRTFEINCLGTFLLIRTLLPNLRLAAQSSMEIPKVIIMSSRMGSISYNSAGGGYAYRASKAALNAMVKSFSIDVPEVVFMLMHPGRVETGLVEWKEEGAIPVDESVRDMIRLVEGFKEEWSGSFVDRWGKDIGW